MGVVAWTQLLLYTLGFIASDLPKQRRTSQVDHDSAVRTYILILVSYFILCFL
ncbi:hypothetical protein BJ741DRAFT_614432 [Chytriomyces cf. hyalinus JEL632]|nr:hypothetical protein BJ741DRAFT_614432 [Chytriomyces cf. hyalinus JEL632]